MNNVANCFQLLGVMISAFTQTVNEESHQLSQTSLGKTVLITAQWPNALVSCHLRNLSVLFLIKTPPSSSLMPMCSSTTSCFGVKKFFLVPLFKKSCSTGSLKVIGELELVQKITIFVKSIFSCSRVSASGRGDSRKIRQVGKTVLMVWITMRADGRRRSPA